MFKNLKLILELKLINDSNLFNIICLLYTDVKKIRSPFFDIGIIVPKFPVPFGTIIIYEFLLIILLSIKPKANQNSGAIPIVLILKNACTK
mgnify:CR=1 FL=1